MEQVNQTQVTEKLDNIDIKALSIRQLAILVFIVSLGAKFFTLPILMMKMGGRVAWVALLALLVIDILVIAAFSVASRKSPDKTAFSIIEETLGRIGSRIIFIAIFVLLAFRAIMLFGDIAQFFSRNIFDGLPNWILLLPVVILCISFGSKSLRSLGRTSEILIFFIVPAIIVVFLLLLKTSNWVRLLPLVGEGSTVDIWHMLTKLPLFFFDVIALFVALGKINRKAGEKEKVSSRGDKVSSASIKQKRFGFVPIISVAIASTIIFVLFLGVFSSYMDVKTVINPQEIGSLTHTAISRFSFGRFDIIALVVMMAGVLLTLGVVFYSLTNTASYIIKSSKKTPIALVLAAAVYLFVVLMNPIVLNEFILKYGIYFAGILGGGFIVILIICSVISNKKISKEVAIDGEQNQEVG
ncbi:MAG: spore germination protein [Firmicutes bacterium]|nr:spore germination protein [Bacillota bacterium]